MSDIKYTPPTHQLISHEDFIAREVEFALCRKFWRAYFSDELHKIDATYSQHGPSYVLNEQLELRKEVPFQINPENRLVFIEINEPIPAATDIIIGWSVKF